MGFALRDLILDACGLRNCGVRLFSGFRLWGGLICAGLGVAVSFDLVD